MESDGVGPKLMDTLHCKTRLRPIEYCDPAVVTARRAPGDDVVSGRPAGVDAIGNSSLLGDAQVHIGLGHPPRHRLQNPVSTVTNVVGDKPNGHPPPRRSPGTPTHPLPTYTFSLSVLCCLPRLRCPPPSSVPGHVPPTLDRTLCYHHHSHPHSPLSSLIHVLHLGMGYSIAP